jgi:hypothetical protein
MWPKKLYPKLQADGSLGQAAIGELAGGSPPLCRKPESEDR